MFVFFLVSNLTFQKTHWLNTPAKGKKREKKKNTIVSGMGIWI
jgi:hypothetical protein